MVHGDLWHNTHECEVAQNPTDGYGRLYTVREAGHHATSPHRMRIETGDLGMDPHKDSTDTKNWPETCTHGMAPFSLFATMAPTKNQTIMWILANTVLYLEYQRRTLSVMERIDFIRRTRWKIYQHTDRMKLVRNYLEAFWTGCTCTTYQPSTPSTDLSKCTFSLFPFFYLPSFTS